MIKRYIIARKGTIKKSSRSYRSAGEALKLFLRAVWRRSKKTSTGLSPSPFASCVGLRHRLKSVVVRFAPLLLFIFFSFFSLSFFRPPLTTMSFVLAHNLPTNETFYPDQYVWVCKSKGLKKKNKEEQRSELFLRAQVIGYDDDNSPHRVRVRYPKGSTYACHPHRLIPVYMPSTTAVIVAAETSEYRRLCVIHTLKSFLEIGCDYGVTVHRVFTQGQISQVWGIDKSAESIAIARQNYPELPFYLGDVLSSECNWPPEIQPEVVAIDINGNRELPAVQQCIQIILQRFQPRLMIVKSRALALTL